MLQRDAIVGHAEAIRTQSRKPSKAHTHKKRQPTNAGQPASAGVPTSLEPNCSRVAGSNPVTSAGDRADVLCVLQDRRLLSDVSVTHCCADTYVATAAEARAAKKVAKNALREPGGYDFTLLVAESYGHQCSATHTLLNLLGRLAADSGRVRKWACVEGALRRLSIAQREEEQLPVRSKSACLLPGCR